jgi:hypothetical protein
MPHTINPIPLACCRAELNARNLRAPSDAELAKLIEADQELTQILNDCYNGPDESGLDTAEREQLLEIIGFKFAGSHWPCNFDSEDYTRQFAKRLVANAEAAGWLIE